MRGNGVGMRFIGLLGLILCVGGCATYPLSENGNHLAYEHGAGRFSFKAPYQDAIKRCAAKNMDAKQTSTACPWRCVTNFECVPRQVP